MQSLFRALAAFFGFVKRSLPLIPLALLTFSIGSWSAAWLFTSQSEPLIVQTETLAESLPIADIEYGCRDQKLRHFWERLDKEQFLRQAQYVIRKTWGKNAVGYVDEWKRFKSGFNCSYFLGIDFVDLDADQVDELLVTATGGMRDVERYIFRQSGSKLEMILADICNIEFELRETSSGGYRDVVLKSNWSGSARSLKQYKFNGRAYVASKCYSEDRMTAIDPIPLTTPRIAPEACDPRNAVVP